MKQGHYACLRAEFPEIIGGHAFWCAASIDHFDWGTIQIGCKMLNTTVVGRAQGMVRKRAPHPTMHNKAMVLCADERRTRRWTVEPDSCSRCFVDGAWNTPSLFQSKTKRLQKKLRTFGADRVTTCSIKKQCVPVLLGEHLLDLAHLLPCDQDPKKGHSLWGAKDNHLTLMISAMVHRMMVARHQHLARTMPKNATTEKPNRSALIVGQCQIRLIPQN